MTLVLNCMTGDYIVQVSDRRLVRINSSTGETIEVADDNANKVVIFGQQAIFSYTGIAAINGESTDIWLAKTIRMSIEDGGETSFAICDRLAKEATRAFNIGHLSYLPNSLKRHSFICMCWNKTENENLYPTTLTISNCEDFDGSWLSVASDTFKISASTLPKENYLWKSIGQPLSPKQQNELERSVKDCVRRYTGPAPVARLFMRTLREIASHNPTVGKGLLVVGLPKDGVRLDEGHILSLEIRPPRRGRMTCIYVSQNDQWIKQCGPNFVSTTGGVITEVVRYPTGKVEQRSDGTLIPEELMSWRATCLPLYGNMSVDFQRLYTLDKKEAVNWRIKI